jgi:hypothetical protein
MREIESAEAAERLTAERGGRRRSLYFLVPVVGVNIMALVGQSAWLFGEASTMFTVRAVGFLIALGVASTCGGLILESIGVYLMAMAHDAALEGYSSGSLRLAAYALSGVMAYLNFSHFSGWSRGMGIVFALVSFVSPFMWSVRIKAAARRALAARGQRDPAGVKLSTNRKWLHPFKSWAVMRHASWAGESDPARAVSAWERETGRQTESAPLRGEIQIEEPAPLSLEVEAAESETVTETVTETRSVSRKRSVSVSREAVMAERLSVIRREYPHWQTENVSYAQIGALLSLSGSQTLKGIRDALYAESQTERVING